MAFTELRGRSVGALTKDIWRNAERSGHGSCNWTTDSLKVPVGYVVMWSLAEWELYVRSDAVNSVGDLFGAQLFLGTAWDGKPFIMPPDHWFRVQFVQSAFDVPNDFFVPRDLLHMVPETALYKIGDSSNHGLKG